VAAASQGGKLSNEEQSSALQWFLSDEPDAGEVATRELELNVGSSDEPRWIAWVIRPIDESVIRAARREANGPRAQRRTGGEGDEARGQARIVVAGTVTPDLVAAAKQQNIPDPAVAVRRRFSHKPGLLTQISGEIMSLSGFDDEDVREASAAKT
jgi:hypothetical protein